MNKKSPKISVIVPVYNVAKYLPKCLDSLILQTYSNLEIICINDGSKDNSLEILQEYAKNDSRIKVLTQENKGLSATRNRGVEIATGDWISFIDSDDWVSLCLYQRFIDDIQNASKTIDIYMFNGFHFGAIENEKFNIIMQFWDMRYWKNFEKSPIHPFEDCIDPFIGIIASYLKIYRTEWYKKNNFQFIEGLVFEDILFNIQTGLKAKNIYLNGDYLYYYRHNAFSIMRTLNKNVFDIFKIFDLVKQEIIQNNAYEKMKYTFFRQQYRYFFDRFKDCPPELKKEFIKKANECFDLTLPDLDEKIYCTNSDIDRFNYLRKLNV